MASVKRYKISKDQLERVVESFVMESANIESKKAPVKDFVPSQSADAKKHIKNKMDGKMVEKGEGVPAPGKMKKKLSQAHDAKKHISKAKATHSTKAKVVKEGEEESLPDKSEIISRLKAAMGDIDKDAIKALRQAAQKKGANKENISRLAQKAIQKAGSQAGSEGEDFMSEGLSTKGKVGLAALTIALAAFGIEGFQQEAIVDQMSEDGVISQVLKDPTWLTAIISSLVGVPASVSAFVDYKKGQANQAALNLVKQGQKNGFTKLVSGDPNKNEFPVVLENPKTGKKVEISAQGNSKSI